MLLGLISGISITLYLARGSQLTTEVILSSFIWAVILGILGARLVHVIDNFDFYRGNLVQIFMVWRGGLAWYGGLIGGVIAIIICSLVRKFSIWQYLDMAAFGVMAGLAIGRIGCTINGDVWGIPTGLPWAIMYTHPEAYARPLNQPLHPVTFYEMALCWAIFGILFWLRKRIKPQGSLFLIMLGAYSLGRFGISWLRGNEAAILGSFHEAHIISLILLAIAIGLLIYRKTGWHKPVADDKVDNNEQRE
jgi:phosphatidylglycerol:prolipoprotein diacylglycerol transferase